MRPLTLNEVIGIGEHLQSLVGVRLQDAGFWDEDILGLEFYDKRSRLALWLAVNLSSSLPLVALLDRKLKASWNRKKPVCLFLNSHFEGQHLLRCEVDAKALMLRIVFENEASLEIQLKPNDSNFVVRANDKVVSHRKTKKTDDRDDKAAGQSSRGDDSARAWAEITSQWLALRRDPKNPASAAAQKKSVHEKERAKLQKVIAKVEAELVTKTDPEWRELGEWLAAHQELEVPEKFRERINSQKNFAWNLNYAFEKAKANARKLAGTEKRLRELQAQLAQFNQDETRSLPSAEESGSQVARRGSAKQVQGQSRSQSQSQRQSKATSLLKIAGSQGRTFHVEEHAFYIGKNARDNLALLRKASAHDLWFHLRDEPGAYGILRCNRGQKLADSTLHEAAKILISHRNKKSATGTRWVVLVAECRFVTPIKGASAGQVTFRNERQLLVTV